jgi:hypothetical protein
LALGWYYRDRRTPGNPVYVITEAAWRTLLSRYVQNVDYHETILMAADTHWVRFPDYDLWMSNTGTFNPTTVNFNPPAGMLATHRKNFYTGVER